jgi:hypothetical protein
VNYISILTDKDVQNASHILFAIPVPLFGDSSPKKSIVARFQPCLMKVHRAQMNALAGEF